MQRPSGLYHCSFCSTDYSVPSSYQSMKPFCFRTQNDCHKQTQSIATNQQMHNKCIYPATVNYNAEKCYTFRSLWNHHHGLLEPSGSRNPLSGFLALDVILKARTIFSPLVVRVTEARKCKAPVGNISSLQAHTTK
jgi:hypothetical protein